VRVVLTIDDANPEVVALETRYFLEGIVRQNEWIMHRQGARIPPLYSSGIVYRVEPWASKVQHFANVLDALERGHADCKVLCCIRAAEVNRELRRRGSAARASLKIYWRRPVQAREALHAGIKSAGTGPLRIFHVQVRHPNGSVEDPSRLLHQ
jgi:hypothetical protein